MKHLLLVAAAVIALFGSSVLLACSSCQSNQQDNTSMSRDQY